jgi:hypothetical protein
LGFVHGLFGGSPVTISSSSILGKNVFVTPPVESVAAIIEQDQMLDHSPGICPTRLQHSLSLPNIWFVIFLFWIFRPVLNFVYRFPPHSGPIPSKMAMNKSHHFQCSSTLPLSLQNDVSPTPSSSAEQCLCHVKYASIDPTFQKTSLPKTHA